MKNLSKVMHEDLEVAVERLKDVYMMIDDMTISKKVTMDKLEQLKLNIAESLSDIEEVTELADWSDTTNERVNTLLNIFEKNIHLLSSSEYRRNQVKNGISPRYIEELDTEELISVYKQNNNSIPKEMSDYYKRKYNITYNGLRERLKKAGVWVGRN